MGMIFYAIFSTATLEEEEVITVSLSAPETVWSSVAAALPTASRVWSVSPAIMQEKWEQCGEQ
jgi:hypothetical protein